MTLRRSHVQQAIAALVAIAFAYGWFFWGTHLAGRAGILLLVLTVPAGVFFGWLTMKLFEFAERMLNE